MTTQRFDLSNKVALVTGAAGLLGIQHAAALLECDATLVITDISSQALLSARKRLIAEFPYASIYDYIMDVTDLQSIFLYVRIFLRRIS